MAKPWVGVITSSRWSQAAGARPAVPYPWQEQRGTRACLAARRHGAILRQLGDVVVIMPPLCIDDDEIDLLVAAAEAGIVEATA